ncbi:MAG: hypothetical protein ABR575_03235 [Actinomycetota bacterium]
MTSSYLRVYQPLSAFTEEEQTRWRHGHHGAEHLDRGVARRWLVSAALPPAPAIAVDEGAFVRTIDSVTYVCPWRTRLRMLSGLVAFRRSLPQEVADAFVPEATARSAVRELAMLGAQRPELRSHILHSNWHVPLRWFSAFADSDRVLVEDKEGLRIRYETRLGDARARLQHAYEILDGSGVELGVIDAVEELMEWIDGFDDDGLLELDYGSVATIFPDEDLVEDRSAALVWSCLEALERGDLAQVGRVFGTLVDRWNEVRTHEVLN